MNLARMQKALAKRIKRFIREQEKTLLKTVIVLVEFVNHNKKETVLI
jgi:hypothetical protein